ncbi:DUF397 domain-containing protein [Lentzea sp. NBRC 102530]|uniref:DUF397 domain-containing protein n=1 Tax=Lentzea sp. NBRC 102530 TaxID=3032201 RepID=UPI0024A0F456|nr:DUF397 domain-containing protein [Lentzea sp. NBRC 102530]GLY54801.1 hypothetical protein Lesp01_84560 [Lentzea sp. NBRC 102530]
MTVPSHHVDNADDLGVLSWRKSTRSGGQSGQCVEVAYLVDSRVAVRDSKNPCGPAFLLSSAAWDGFRCSL